MILELMVQAYARATMFASPFGGPSAQHKSWSNAFRGLFSCHELRFPKFNLLLRLALRLIWAGNPETRFPTVLGFHTCLQ